MSTLHNSEGGSGEERLRIIFFHGLNGHYTKTWTSFGRGGVFWPDWLLEDAPGTRVTTVQYDASPSHWFSAGMPIADRAANIAAQLASEGMLDMPLALVGHSLGGNIIKALIRHLSDHQSVNEKYRILLNNIRLVIFLGTPHSGSMAQRLLPGFVQAGLRYTKLVRELDADSTTLRDLNQWYRSNAPEAAKHLVLVEAQRTGGVTIVSPSSSDPGLSSVVPIPIDSTHIRISKPSSRDSEIYKVILDAVKDALSDSLSPVLQDPVSLGRDPAERTQRRQRGIGSRMDAHRKSLIEAAEQRPFTILLCGPPALDPPVPGAALCTRIGDLLLSDGFDVVFGQARGMANPRLGKNDNVLGRELDFIASQCNAVIVVASGASGWTELGLFGWHIASDKAAREKGIDIVVLADDDEVDSGQFIREGPIAYADAAGRADIVSMRTYDPSAILSRMRARRSLYVMDRRGRPKGSAA